MHPPRNQNLIGPQLRRLRMKAGLSQEQLAGRLQVQGWDISRGGVSKIEAKLRLVNDAELWVLARTLSCRLDDLYPTKPETVPVVLRHGRH